MKNLMTLILEQRQKKFIKNKNNNDFIFQPIHLIDSLGISLNAKEVQG